MSPIIQVTNISKQYRLGQVVSVRSPTISTVGGIVFAAKKIRF
ncbi:MAG: hypothetical protein SH818_19930 [Saprospiraceae bacterium]|nr:hypothetical protein [Saprospiraceae bacterium]